MRKPRTFFLLVMAVLPLVVAGTGAVWGQSPQEDRVRELLERFDSRLPDVQTLVDSSRDPNANAILQQAISLRNQAANELQANRFDQAFSLATRALDRLKQAEDIARQGGTPVTDRLLRMLEIQRQQLNDTRRLIGDLEAGILEGDGAAQTPVLELFERQKERTLELIEEAEACCEQAGSVNSTLGADRCEELVRRARELYEQAVGNLPDSPIPPAVNTRAAQNRIRDARRLVDRTQTELDQIEREIDNGAPGMGSSIVTRLNNAANQNRLAGDLLSDAGVGNFNLIQGQANSSLGLLRRASDLARSALAACQGSSSQEGPAQFDRQNAIVEDLILRVENLLQTPPSNLPGAGRPQQLLEQGIDLRGQAEQLAGQDRYIEALNLLSQAATVLNQALAALGANVSGAARLEVLEDLQAQFDRRRGAFDSQTALSAECQSLLDQADQLRQESENLAAGQNLEAAFGALNQAQRRLSQAAACVGLDVPRIQSLLDRLQSEFDRRRDSLPDDISSPAAVGLMGEADDLRDFSDSQEAQGNLEQAVQTVGRAITALTNAQRLLADADGTRGEEILSQLQDQFDVQVDKVRERVEAANSAVALQSLAQAEVLRGQSDSSEANGQIDQALNEIGRAIQLMEQALVQSINAANLSGGAGSPSP